MKCDGDGEGRIKDCKKCNYNNNELKCNECKNKYVLKDNENNQCYSKELFKNDKKYYYEDEYYIKRCSFGIINCEECEKENDNLKCMKCINDYFLVDDDYYNCKQESEINPIDEYFLNDEKNHYYSCGNNKYNSVENCQKCINNYSCNLCKEGYKFIYDNKALCKNIIELGDEYIPDLLDSTMYRKCNYYISNCKRCSSRNECLSCNEQYGLYNDKSKCINKNDQTYYKNELNKLYYLCSDAISKCEKCSSNNVCNNCINDYIRINKDKSSCHSIYEINNEEYYIDPDDINMYLKCSYYIDNCYSCDYNNGCNYCKSGYALINDDYMNCIDKSRISSKTYFSENGIMYYSCDEQKYKNNLQCFSLVPKQTISLSFLQIQKIKYKLYCYMMTHSPLPKDFSLNIKLNIYNSKNTRILEESKDVIFTTNDDSDGSSNKIITFISDNISNDLKDNNVNIKIEEIKFNGNNPTTKTVVDNNICSLKFDKNSDFSDTGKVNSMIQAKKIPDLSKSQQIEIVSLNIDKIEGCEFNLNSEEPVSFTNKNLELELVESKNNSNIVKARCNTEKKY